MTTKAPGPDETLDLGPNPNPVLLAWSRISRLKTLYRQGWLRRGILPEHCESVADHSFGTAILALLAAPGRGEGYLFEGFSLDPGRLALLGLAHELGEAYGGDITPADGLSREEKHSLEAVGVERALAGLPGANFFRELWLDYEEGRSPEARFLRQVDKLEMGLQAAAYRSKGEGRMEEFFQSARAALGDKGLREILEAAIAGSDPVVRD